MAFKLYMWNRTTWEMPEFIHANFDYEVFSDAETQACRRSILELYAALPSKEFWLPQILDNTLSQLRFTEYENRFSDAVTVRLLVDQIYATVDDLEKMANTGHKNSIAQKQQGATFDLYHNEIMHTSNIFLVESPVKKLTFFTYDNPNYIMSDDPFFCQYTGIWFDKIRRRSQKISIDGEKNRKVFFNTLRRRIDGWRKGSVVI